jgi:hypothetical protein
MADVGNPIREIEHEPLEAPAPVPIEVPEEIPEEVPA